MKTGSDNFRSSAIQDIIENLKNNNMKILLFEPTLNAASFNECPVLENFDDFISQSDIILANRLDETIIKYNEKVYTRDLFERD